MKTALKTAMMTSISEVLETMFFMSLEFDDQASIGPDVIQGNHKTNACRINFSGRFAGYFVLYVPERILLNMTEGFTGMDPHDITDEHSGGTLKEAVNMLAGSTLSAYDDKSVFQLTIPEIIDIASAMESGRQPDEEEVLVIMETIEGRLALKAVIES